MTTGQAGRDLTQPRLDLGALLAAAEAAPPIAAVDVVGDVLAEMVGAREVGFLIADLSGRALMRLGHSKRRAGSSRSRETAERVPLQGTPQGEALATQALVTAADAEGAWLYAPVSSRGEAVGVLELRVDGVPDPLTLADVAVAAHALAYIVIANGRYTDLFQWGQRSVPLSLAAEIQHGLLPGSYTCEGGAFTLAAWLEPAGDVGGDTFDFSVARDTLMFSITDAMGHTVAAALLATLLVGSLRHGRRRDVPLSEQARLGNEALSEHAGPWDFVTGQIVRVDLATGTAQIINAGHPPPLRIRDGEVTELALEADPAFGMFPDTQFRIQQLPLEPGDRLLFVTDGVLERHAAEVDVRTMLASSRSKHPREAVQQLIGAAVEASGGQLADDATALCFDWRGAES